MAEDIDLHVGAGFARWLAGADATVVITTYQAGKIVLVDHDGSKITVLILDLASPMGIAIDGRRDGSALRSGARMAIALRDRVVVFADSPELAQQMPGRPAGSFEHLYSPRVTYATGDIRAHEIAFGREGLWIVNTRLSCLCLASVEHAFEPRWLPKFVSACVPEDRCHLTSGLAIEGGAPAYVTAHGATDSRGGWRDRKLGGGVVIDVARGDPLAGGFTMPHSPRIHDGALWVLDSGQGVLAEVDRRTGARTPVASVPASRAASTSWASTPSSASPRSGRRTSSGGMPVSSRHRELHAGVVVVKTSTGEIEGVLRFTSGCDEIFDVAVLRGKHRVQFLDPSSIEAPLGLSAPDFAFWVDPPKEG